MTLAVKYIFKYRGLVFFCIFGTPKNQKMGAQVFRFQEDYQKKDDFKKNIA
jgi:hypothetical protein